ncbi:hypothetical protein U0035_21210 [Niabella yanshanensis]|uniref:Uncharacterized protein n=1 Tax=Niabella yanshanensis TaxID=577386 RepID=A0ABZ0W9J0_9BACT|nr:hypothetical protein [Niabella yanshanensis]WQD38192.1 hypothetical protein U0035_21210 [Niabella yanshanensis]
MKKIILISLLGAFLFQALSSLVILTAFHLNRDYISNNLCVNRFDAVPLCKGSCYLEKQLSDNEQQQQDTPKLKLKEISLFYDNRKIDIERPVSITGVLRVFPVTVNSILLQGATPSILKPPILIG